MLSTNSVETQVVQAVTGLLALAMTAGIGYLAPRAKRWIEAHTNAKTVAVATTALDGLSRIAESVVQDFNQRVVSDAKKNGVWNTQLAQQVKHDAVQSVMSQAGELTSLASSTVGNVQDLVTSMIESAVANNKVSSPEQVTPTDSGQTQQVAT